MFFVSNEEKQIIQILKVAHWDICNYNSITHSFIFYLNYSTVGVRKLPEVSQMRFLPNSYTQFEVEERCDSLFASLSSC